MSKVLNIYQTNFSQTHCHSYPQPHRHVLTYIHIERETQSFLERENEDDRNNTPFSSETIRCRREYKKLRILMNRSMVRSLPQLELREKTICPGCTIYKWRPQIHIHIQQSTSSTISTDSRLMESILSTLLTRPLMAAQ
ncbi:hypothetical protein CsSME_00026774 [Camellia sinensis var. sinensis]